MLVTDTTKEALQSSLESIWLGNFLKAVGADDEEDKWREQLDPWNTSTDALDNFLSQTASPDPDGPDATPTEVALHSHALNYHIASAKLAALRGDHASVQAHLDSMMSHQVPCHSAACAAAAD